MDKKHTPTLTSSPPRKQAAETLAKPLAPRPTLHYLGSKWRIAPWIIENLPPHKVYVEPFGGGAAVLLRKDPSNLEIYNDLDSMVVNFWRVLRTDAAELVRRLKLTPWSREEYLLAWEPTDDPIERARRLFIRTWMAYSGETDRPSGWRAAKTERKNGTIIQWGVEERLLAVATRWREVQIEHDNALKVIRRFDTPNALFYCDPPYVHSTRSSGSGYAFERNDDEHLELLDLLNGIQGKALISGYPCDLYKIHLPARRWRRLERESRTRDPKANRTEVLYIRK
jgi:DNA adenine methylase